MNTNITTIIFDFGGVLVNWDPRNLYRRFFSDPQEMESFLTEINFIEWNAQFDKGRPFSEGIALLSGQFPQYARFIRAYQEYWGESIIGFNPGAVEILQTLKNKNYPLYGLSNWSAETFPIARKKFSFFEMFDNIILSGELKLIKPEPEIYERCLQIINKSAHECLFIDDSEPNIKTAKELGFHTIRFTSPENLKSDLRARQIL